MSAKPRQRKNLKKKIVVYVLLIGIIGCVVFFLNSFISSRKPLYISPIGKVNTDKTDVGKLLKENKIPFSKVTVSDNSYFVDIEDNGQVKFSLDKDINQQISSLQRILIQLTIEGKLFKSIDFRFSEPIVVF